MDACATEARVAIDPYDSTFTLSSIPARRGSGGEYHPNFSAMRTTQTRESSCESAGDSAAPVQVVGGRKTGQDYTHNAPTVAHPIRPFSHVLTPLYPHHREIFSHRIAMVGGVGFEGGRERKRENARERNIHTRPLTHLGLSSPREAPGSRASGPALPDPTRHPAPPPPPPPQAVASDVRERMRLRNARALTQQQHSDCEQPNRKAPTKATVSPLPLRTRGCVFLFGFPLWSFGPLSSGRHDSESPSCFGPSRPHAILLASCGPDGRGFLLAHSAYRQTRQTWSTFSKRALDSGMPAMSSRLSTPSSSSAAAAAGLFPLPPFFPPAPTRSWTPTETTRPWFRGAGGGLIKQNTGSWNYRPPATRGRGRERRTEDPCTR